MSNFLLFEFCEALFRERYLGYVREASRPRFLLLVKCDPNQAAALVWSMKSAAAEHGRLRREPKAFT